MLMVVGQVWVFSLTGPEYPFLINEFSLLICFLSDYTLVDSEYLLPIPENVNPSEAAPVLCAGRLVRKSPNHSQTDE